MCWADCFMCCFSLQTGAIFTSAYMLALAIMGILYLPFLPFSNEFGTFIVIYIYMILLLVTFLLALFGALSESKFALLAALIMSVVALLFWLYLTVPSFLTKDTPNCLGFRCGESHWLLPRMWVPDEDLNDNFIVYTTPKHNARMLDREEVTPAQTDLRSASLLNEKIKVIETRLDKKHQLDVMPAQTDLRSASLDEKIKWIEARLDKKYQQGKGEEVTPAQTHLRSASLLDEKIKRIEALLDKNQQGKGEKDLKAIEAKLNELNELRKSILTAQRSEPEGGKNHNPRKEHGKKKDTNKGNEGNHLTPEANIETKDQETTTQIPKRAENILERMIDQSIFRAMNRNKHQKTEGSNEIGTERQKRSLTDDQDEIIRHAIDSLWTQLVTSPLQNTNRTQRELLNLKVNKTLQSFLFGNETNSLISRTVNHQKTIISSCRAHKADSLINPSKFLSTALAFLYFFMFATAIATLAMYYGSFLLNHGIEKCCVSECMM